MVFVAAAGLSEKVYFLSAARKGSTIKHVTERHWDTDVRDRTCEISNLIFTMPMKQVACKPPSRHLQLLEAGSHPPMKYTNRAKIQIKIGANLLYSENVRLNSSSFASFCVGLDDELRSVTTSVCFDMDLLRACVVISLTYQMLVQGQPETVLVKIGGSSLTDKATKETLNATALDWFVGVLKEQYLLNKFNFVVVHGAGSFGHHTANDYGLRGHDDPPTDVAVDEEQHRYFMKGLAETRLSVQKLNHLVVDGFIKQGIPSVGVSPCFGIPGIQAHGGDDDIERAFQDLARIAVEARLVPILHGDACLYGRSAGILSGDTLMKMLGRATWVSRVVFLTDVEGVFTADPRVHSTAELLRDIAVDISGHLVDVVQASGSQHAHDVTGGLKAKLRSAAAIAATGKNVTIALCGSSHAERVLGGDDTVERATVLRRNEDDT